MENQEWVLCPVCKNKTRIRIREDIMLSRFPLFCPKCRQETLINVEQLKISIIKEPDAEPIIRYQNGLSALFCFTALARKFRRS